MDEPDIEKILMEINGYRVADGAQLKSFEELKDDGSTACGGWLYCGVFPEKDTNRANRRNPKMARMLYADWGLAWPHNRRVMYNRASADPGRPALVRSQTADLVGRTAPRNGRDMMSPISSRKPPDYRPAPGHRGLAPSPAMRRSRMLSDGRGWLFVPYGLKDGPLPVHYEPHESPYRNMLNGQQSNPFTIIPPNPGNPLAPPGDPNFPLVATSYRLTEHYLSGPMSRFDSWLSELQPEMFAEISPELAADRGVANGDWVVISTPRGEIETKRARHAANEAGVH